MSETAGLLQQSELFRGFTAEELETISALCREERHNDGDRVVVEGNPARTLYLIAEGKVSLEKKVQLGRSGSSRRATVSVQGVGQAIGWSSLVDPPFYTMTGVCMGPVRLLAIDGNDMRRYMADKPEVGLKIMNVISTLVKGRMTATTNTLTYFLSIISHELRSPMAAIESYLEVLLGGFAGELTDQQRKMLERSTLRIKDLRSLVSDILDLARMQPEHIRADFEWLDPAKIGAEAIEDVGLAARERGIALEVDMPSAFQPIVGAYRRLRQVLSNLLSNAIKFSPEDSVVTLRVREEPDRLVVEVLDEGIGIPVDEQEQVFRDFFRGRNIGETGGTGLGLSIVKKIVDAHHGKIWVESPYAAGKSGTKFTVVIPRDLATPEMKQEEWRVIRAAK